ncbi:MAG: hypothetical protein LC687_00505 [Actinobacteria bacterium]|nr:hypothetical protein [Actinomycetota bacterium]
MKHLLVALLAVAVLGCGPTEPEPEVNLDVELARIDSLLENCLEGERQFRHHVCYERAVQRVDELAARYGVVLDK